MCMYYVYINIFRFLYMLILTVFVFSLEVFISLFSRWGKHVFQPLQGGSRALPQGFGPETLSSVEIFGRFVTEGFWTPQKPTEYTWGL